MAMVPSVQPGRPWRVKRNELLAEVASLVVALAATGAVVALTGFQGKLAWAVLLLLFAMSFTALNEGRQRGLEAAKNAAARAIVMASAVIVLVPLISIMWTVFNNGRVALRPNFFTQDMAIASGDGPFAEGGALHAIIGTAQLVLMASVVSIPVGILTALYLTEIRGRLSSLIRFLTQAMSGVPSVVAGLFVYSAWILGPGKGYSGLAGAMSLSILMLPTVARTAEEVLKLVPDHLREAGQALGGTQWRTVSSIVLPTAKSGLFTAGILGVARISGETAPLLLTIFGASAINLSINDGPISALPVFVFTHLKLGTDNAVARAWTGALVLMVLVLVLFSAARWLGGRKTR